MFKCLVWPWTLSYGSGSRSLHIVSMRTTFVPSKMVIHQCIRKLQRGHKMLLKDRRRDWWTDKVHSYNPLPILRRGLKMWSYFWGQVVLILGWACFYLLNAARYTLFFVNFAKFRPGFFELVAVLLVNILFNAYKWQTLLTYNTL